MMGFGGSSGGSGGGGGTLSVTAFSVFFNGFGLLACGGGKSGSTTSTPNTQVNGGSGNYSFIWTYVSGVPDRGPWVISNATIQNPTWRAPGPICASDVVRTEVWKVTVTDNTTAQIATAQINVSITWTVGVT